MFEEADGDGCPFRMILNRDYGCFGLQRAVFAIEHDAIGKFQGVVDGKQDFVGRAELDDGVLNIRAVACECAGSVISAAAGAAELDGNPHGGGFGKEAGQAAYDVLFESVSGGLAGHGETSIPGNGTD